MGKIANTKLLPSCPNCKTRNMVSRIESDKFDLFFCKECNNGFLFPIPKNLNRYYPPQYWQFPGQLSFIREGLHNLFQNRRKEWFKKYLSSGQVLDVGAGEGVFGKFLGEDFEVTNLETPQARIQNKNTIKVDFLRWKTNKKFNGIVFLESLEHVHRPQAYLEKASKLLKEGGYIFIECPKFNCWESKIFGKYWLHRDIPRHLVHFTNTGLQTIATRTGLQVVNQKSILSYEYSPMCLLVSLMNSLKVKPLNLRVKSFNNIFSLFLLAILSPLAFLIETIFFFFDQSPILLTILKKR